MAVSSDKSQEDIRRTTGAVTQELSQFSIPNIILYVEAPAGKIVKIEATAQDCVLDIRQFLLDCSETCDLTCYHLEYEGEEVNDYCELAEYASLLSRPGPHYFKMVTDYYDERSARLHVRRLREVLVHPPTKSDHSPALFYDNKQGSKVEGAPKSAIHDQIPIFTLKELHAEKKTKPDDACIPNLNFSAWNPPPGNRRIRGDLLYLECSTHEGRTHHITSSPEGFYLNCSSNEKFDPSPNASPYKSHTLGTHFACNYASALLYPTTTTPQQ